MLVTGDGRGSASPSRGSDGRRRPSGHRGPIGRRVAVAELAEGGGEVMGVTVDVAEEAGAERAVAATVDRFGAIDALVNNAAILEPAPLLETSAESFDRVMRTNVRGVFLMTRAAGLRMAEAGSGVIINIGSDLAMRGRADYGSYAASKGAVLQLTRTSAIELGAHGVRVVMLSPAVTNTEMARPALEDPDVRAALLAKGTLPRFNEPEDVAAAAVFLASHAARTVTGCNWPVDAGVLAR